MKTDLFKKKLFATTLLASMVGGLCAGTAIAQDAPVAVDTVTEEDLEVIEEVSETDEARQEKVVVTGSRIARDSFTSTAPLQVITADTIKASGAIDVGEIIKSASVVTGNQLDQTVTTSGFLGDSGPGGSSIGLRGLGADRTLTLINGRRFAPAGVEGAPTSPDLSLLPSSIIERIDILLDGASSVYGSDAVAGVVNVVLRDEYDGFRVSSTLNNTLDPGGESFVADFILGSVGDRGSYMFAGEYVTNEPLKANSRDWMASDDGVFCDRAIELDANGQTIQQCNPAQAGIGILQPTFVLYYGIPGTTAAGSDLGSALSGALTAGIPDFVNGRGGLAASPNGYGRWRDYPSFGQQEFDVRPAFQRTSLFFDAKRDLDILGGVELFTEVLYSNRQTTANAGRGQFTAPIPKENPFNPFGVNAVPGSLGAVFGPQDASSLLLTPWDSEQYVELDQMRLIGGLRGDMEFLNETWDYELFAGYTRSQGYSERTGVNENNLALAAYTTEINADGNPVCGINLIAADPGNFGGFFGIDPETCVPINFFSPTLFSANPTFAEGQAAVDFLRDIRTVSTFVDEQIIGGFTTGTLMELPAGEMKGVFGFEWREDAIDTRSDSVAQRGTLDGFFFDRPTRGSVNLGEIYGELFIPLVKDQPLAYRAELELAARGVEHEFYGQNGTYSAKAAYAPFEWLTFKGTYGTSFRAPNLRELFLEGQSSFQTASDPCEVPALATAFDPVTGDPFYDASQDDRDPQVLANCVSEGLDPTTLGLRGGSTAFQAVSAGNIGLEAEESTAWSYGFTLEQPFFDEFDLTLGVTRWEVDVQNDVFTPTLNTVLGLCYTSDQFPNDAFCSRRKRDPVTGFLTEVDSTPFNVAEQVGAGTDFNVAFGSDFSALGTDFVLDVSLEATKSEELSTLITIPGQPDDFDDNLGEIGLPEWRARVLANLDINEDVRVFWSTRYIGGQEDSTPPPTTTANGVSTVASVEEYFLSDASVRYQGDSWSARVGIQNVFDEDPPLVDQDVNPGFVSARNVPLGVGYDQLGRRIFVSVSKEF